MSSPPHQSSTALPSTMHNLQNEAICSICLDYFNDPVSIACGHNYCRTCISQHWAMCKAKSEGQASVLFPCPQCRKLFRRPNFRPNREFANVVDLVRQLQENTARCDEDTGEGVGAASTSGVEPSQAMSTSSASTETVQNVPDSLTGPMCVAHQNRPLSLYCHQHGLCCKEPDHRDHGIISVEKAALEYKKKLLSCLAPLKEEMEGLLKVKSNEEKAMRDLKKELERRRVNINNDFVCLHQFLKEEQRVLLTQLVEAEKEMMRSLKETVAQLSSKISTLKNLASDIEATCLLPDQELVEDVKATLARCEQASLQAPCQEPLSAMLQKSLSALPEGVDPNIMLKKFRDHVTLDPKTANPGLVISEDLCSVKRGEVKQVLSDNPERFDMDPCVLGVQGFSSGCHYWEVDVGRSDHWVVGAACESINRKGLIHLSPMDGIWAMRLIRVLVEDHYQALTFPGRTTVALKPSPQRIGVYLDYEGSRLSFYNASNMAHIYTFCQTFREKIFPLFWVMSTEMLSIINQ